MITKRLSGSLLALPILLMALAPTPALAQGFLDTMLGTMLAQTDNWMQRGVEVALAIFMALALIEFAWHGIQLVLKKGELSELFAGVMLKVTALGFFYTLIIYAPQWVPLISQTFETAGQRISGLPPGQLTPSGLIDTGIATASMIFDAPLQRFSLTEIGRSLLTSIIAAITSIMTFIAFLVIAIQLFVVKVEMLMVVAGGVVMLAMSGSRWSINFAEKYIGYAVSVGAKLIIISILAGFGATFGQSIVSDIGSNNQVLRAPQLFALLGTSGIFAVMSYMIPSLAGSFLSGAASMSLANTAAAGGSMASMAGSGIGRMAGVAAGAAGGALGMVAKLAAPAAAVGSIAGLAGGAGSGSSGGAGSIGGAARSAFRGGGAAASGSRSGAVGSISSGAGSGVSGTGTNGTTGLGKPGSAPNATGGAAAGGGTGPSAANTTGTSSPKTGGFKGSGSAPGFANPNPQPSNSASSSAPAGSGNPTFPGGSGASSGSANAPMDYRDQERAAEKDYRARASSSPFSRAMLKASDKLKDAGDKSSAFARRQRRPMASDGNTGGSPSIRFGLSGD